MKLYNSLTRQIEELKPLHPPVITLYTCGPTVYDYTHLGHMRTFTNTDVLKRALTYFGFKVNHVMNITDVGHLTGDDDTGEDKLEKGAQKVGKSVWEVAQFYTDFFMKTMRELNITPADTISKATDHIPEMIKLIKTLQEKGYTYETDEALYFDIAKFSTYGILSGQKLEEKKKGSREEVRVDPQKKHPADFALWFKRVGRFKDHMMHWDSPWGDGFPGWHIECSTMSMKYLGETIDIHSGGVDHIPTHHENEIAQSEAATGKPFVQYWVHHNFLQVEGQKMSKSLGNFFTIDDVRKKGINPLSLRLLFLQTHYRQEMNFTWEAAKGADEAYRKLKELVRALRSQTNRTTLSEEKLGKLDEYRKRFNDALANDLQTPQAVAIMWEMLKSNIPSEDKLDLLFEMDQVFGLNLQNNPSLIFNTIRVGNATIVQGVNLTNSEVQPLESSLIEREKKRLEKDYQESDLLREKIEEKGFVVKDDAKGTTVTKK